MALLCVSHLCELGFVTVSASQKEEYFHEETRSSNRSVARSSEHRRLRAILRAGLRGVLRQGQSPAAAGSYQGLNRIKKGPDSFPVYRIKGSGLRSAESRRIPCQRAIADSALKLRSLFGGIRAIRARPPARAIRRIKSGGNSTTGRMPAAADCHHRTAS
jgi:hypothetical protein